MEKEEIKELEALDEKMTTDIVKVNDEMHIEVPMNILDALDVQMYNHLKFIQKTKNEYIIEKVE